jgi:hypothetical protein
VREESASFDTAANLLKRNKNASSTKQRKIARRSQSHPSRKNKGAVPRGAQVGHPVSSLAGRQRRWGTSSPSPPQRGPIRRICLRHLFVWIVQLATQSKSCFFSGTTGVAGCRGAPWPGRGACRKTLREGGWALQAAEKLIALKGHGFSCAVSGVESTRALALEERFSANSPPILHFPAACLAAATFRAACGLFFDPFPCIASSFASKSERKLFQMRLPQARPALCVELPSAKAQWN